MNRAKKLPPFLTVDVIVEMPGGLVLVRRRNRPFGWALPGGFVDAGESLEAAAAREVSEETGLRVSGLRQFRAYGDPGRDPRGHAVSVVFSARARGRPRGGDDAAAAAVFGWDRLPAEIAFDHRRIIDQYRAAQKKYPAGPLKGRRIGIVGAGRMGMAIARGSLEAGVLDPADLMLCDSDRRRLAAAAGLGAAGTSRIEETFDFADILILAVKPQDRAGPVAEIAARARKVKKRRFILVTVLAGVPCAWFERELGPLAVVRVMPNLGITVGAGMSVICAGKHARPAHLAPVRRLFQALGETAEVGEEVMDAVTALSGSGPAYFFKLMEALSVFAAGAGLGSDEARKMIRATALAAARLAEGAEPAQLRRAVTSPGGTTAAALRVLEEGGFDQLVCRALEAAVRRGRELAG